MTEYDKIVESIKKVHRPKIVIKPEFSDPDMKQDILPRTASKFGGEPYAPLDFKYPEFDGQPMLLLAQINLEDTKGYTDLPDKGILQFYIAENNGSYGLTFDQNEKNEGFKVVYHSDIQENIEHQLVPTLERDSETPINCEHKLIFEEIKEDFITPVDFGFEDIVGCDVHDLDDFVGDRIYDDFIIEESKIGGYPFFTQEDPRSYEMNDKSKLLLQISSTFDSVSDIMWGDSGVGGFFITDEDLKNLNFDNVYYNWDCC